MYYVYILKSSKSGILYYGYTEDLKKRFHEHNSGKSKFTKGHIPWKLVSIAHLLITKKLKILNFTSSQDQVKHLHIKD